MRGQRVRVRTASRAVLTRQYNAWREVEMFLDGLTGYLRKYPDAPERISNLVKSHGLTRLEGYSKLASKARQQCRFLLGEGD